MRGEIVYQVYGVHEGRPKDNYFGTYRTVAETEAKIADLSRREMNGRNWAAQYHNRGFAIRAVTVETEFEIPPLPKPRDRYAVRGTPKPNRPGTWGSTLVEVFRRGGPQGGPEKICEYVRNYGFLATFEPFRQGHREFALISRDYTQTAVLDLQSGEIVAEEADSDGDGFCPVGFYVPDWWDVNDGSLIPGSKYWNADREWPTGRFGFVWGCYWGDDSSWKVQYLDLSDVQNGTIRRDDRFGYVELATMAYPNPCLDLEIEPGGKSRPPFISLYQSSGAPRVTFAVEMQFGLDTGKPKEWQRQRIANFE